MFPKFKYLSRNIFSPKKPDQDRHLEVQYGYQNPSVQNHPSASDIFTTIQTSVVDNHTKEGATLISSISTGASGGLFTGARDFTMNNPTFIDNSKTTNYFVDGFPVLRDLGRAGTLDAALDSAVRYPPPKCYPGSRQTINARLEQWLLNLYRQRKMTWLYGPAGIGKSAIAQTFGELAEKRRCLGAAFFNVLPAEHFRIIPTLAYQLATRSDSYKRIITEQLVGNPSILRAALHIQFQKLIIEPFSHLTPPDAQQSASTQPFLIILDGLDDLEDEDAQCQLIELINNAAQRDDLPLIWLLCSRPESHIKYTFAQEEFVPSCDREELVIDDEARADVDQFLQKSFKEIYARYQSVIAVTVGGAWPPKEVLDKISKSVSGYFVFASAVTRVVGDRTVGDPKIQLSTLLRMLQGLDDIAIKDPFEALDIFYSRILSRVPQHLLPIAIQILGICARGQPSNRHISSAEQFWLFLRIGKAGFYLSLEKLHSVVNVPAHEDARNETLSFYHRSFGEYLRKEHRSGRFFLSDARVKALLGVSGLYWYNHILVYNNRKLVGPDEHRQSQAMLKEWSYGNEVDNVTLMRLGITASWYFGISISVATETDTDFFGALRDFNFGLFTRVVDDIILHSFMEFMHIWDWSKTAAGSQFVRTEVVDEHVDPKLLHHLSILANGKPVPPIEIHEPTVDHRGRPLPWKGQPNTMGYVIIGRGAKSGLVCCYQEARGLETTVLNSLTLPTEAQIRQYREWEEKVDPPELVHDTPAEIRDPECLNQ